MNWINLFLSLFFKEKKIQGTNLFLCPFSKQQLMTFARENLFMLIFFTFLLAHKEKEMNWINLFLSLFFKEKKIQGTNLFLCPFSKQQLMTFARENLSMLNLFYISFSAQGERNGKDKFIFKPFFFRRKKTRGQIYFFP